MHRLTVWLAIHGGVAAAGILITAALYHDTELARLLVRRPEVSAAAPSWADGAQAGPSVVAADMKFYQGDDCGWRRPGPGLALASTKDGHDTLVAFVRGGGLPAHDPERLLLAVFAGRAAYRPGPSVVVPFACLLRGKNELRVVAFVRDPDVRRASFPGVSSPWVVASVSRGKLPALPADVRPVLEEVRELRRDVPGLDASILAEK